MKTFITTISLFFVLFTSTSAQVIKVPEDMGAIQDALDAALPGDTVIVSPGTYYENLVWPNTESICLISESGPETTIIDGSNTESVIRVTTGIDTTTVISGFTIQNGSSDFGAGIVCSDTSSPIIYDNIIKQNTSSFAGGGIGCIYNSLPIIKNNTITGNHANHAGGGIAGGFFSSPIITNNIITENNAEQGGGIAFDHCSSIIVNNVITGNTAPDDFGGGIVLVNCNDITIDSNTISNNSSPRGGGVFLTEMSEATITNNTISGNTADSTDGGGIYCDNNSDVNITGNTITGNQANYSGGGIYCDDNSELNITGNTITGNQANYFGGGGIYAHNSNLQIDNCTFTENTAGDDGGAIRYDADTTYSGLPYQVELTNSQFLNNTATNTSGGVMINVFDADPSLVNVVVNNCEFLNNNADNYTGLRIRRSVFTVSNSVFTDNTAVRFAAGAGFSSGSIGTVSNCLFSSNIANTGGGNWNSGGVSVWSGANVDFMNCTFADNSAYYGASLTVGYSVTTTTTNCIFWGNSTDQIALDTLYGQGGTLTVNYCDVQDGENSVNVIDTLLSTLNWGNGNIDSDPFFVDPLASDYHLQDTSPCIGTAIDSIEINGIMRYCPLFDIEGNDRPDPPGSMPDIGAYESELAIPVGLEENETVYPTEYALYQNFPNPFNPSTIISYSVPELSFVTLKVYDVLGSEILALVNEEKSVGSYEVEFVANNLPSGIYFYQLQANDFIQIKKMILLK